MVDIDTANYKSEIKRLERDLAARNEQLIVATKLADSRYNELQELQADNGVFIRLLSEMNRYLDTSKDTSIGHGCIFHREINSALEDKS